MPGATISTTATQFSGCGKVPNAAALPDVLTSDEVRQLLAALDPRERIMVLLDVATGLRQSELFALKWKDVDFSNKQLWVTRSIVQQVVGHCKTEASQKPVPLHDHLISSLRSWNRRTPYRTPESWVFASPQNRGKKPYWGQQLLRHHIRPVAKKLGITKRIGWHTFRRRCGIRRSASLSTPTPGP
jgi:integrase